MKVDQNNYKFYRSFRLKAQKSDKVFVIIKKIIQGDIETYSTSKCQVLDFNDQGVSFNSDVEIPMDSEVEFIFKCEKFLTKFSKTMRGELIRSFVSDQYSKEFNYAIKFIDSNTEINSFINTFIGKFNKERLLKYFKESCFNSRNADFAEAKEVFSLLTSIFQNFLKNEETKNIHNKVDFESIQSQLNLDCLKLLLIDDNDKFVSKQSTIDSKGIYDSNDFEKLRLKSFATGTLISKKIIGQSNLYYLCSPVVNKFNNSIGILEFVREEKHGQYSFEDEKVIQLMAYILSSQLKTHRPVIPSSVFEHLNPRKKPEGFFLGISKTWHKIQDLISTSLLTKSSILLVGDESDRALLTDYIFEKNSVITNSIKVDIKDIEKLIVEEEYTYFIQLENSTEEQILHLGQKIDKNSNSKFILSTSYHHWASLLNTYYSLNIINSVIPPFTSRQDDYLEIAEHVCDLNVVPLKESVKHIIKSGTSLKDISNFKQFKNFVLGNQSLEESNVTNKEQLERALLSTHDINISIDDYMRIVDSSIQSFSKNIVTSGKIEISKKAA